MVDPISGLPSNALIETLASTFGSNAVQTFLGYVEQGVPVSQAYSMAFGNDVRHDGRADAQALAQAFDAVPEDVRQRIVQGADTLPPAVREALDQLGITQPQQRNDAANQAALQSARAEGAVPTREGFANTAAQGPAAATAGNPFAAQEAVQRTPGQQVAAAPHADRSFNDFVALQPNARNEGFVAGRAVDSGQAAVVMSDRMQAAQQQTQAQQLPFAQGRADALSAQIAPALAGATLLANPQANPVPGQAPTTAPPGTDAAAAQAREAHLVPAGHTISGFLRRDLRRGTVQAPRERMPGSGLLALLPGRRGRPTDQDESAPVQWLFWVLTIIAYGAVAVAVVAMLPSGGGLTDVQGSPTYGAWALVVGAVAALASWMVGKRLSRR